MASIKDRLKEILLRDNLISPPDLERAIEEQKKSGSELSKILLKHNLIKENVLIQALSESLGIPLINLSRLTIDTQAVHLIPREIAEKYQVFPISVLSDQLTLAMADPLNIFMIDNIKAITGFAVNPVMATKNDILQAIERHYQATESHKPSETFDAIVKDIKDSEELELIRETEGGKGGKAEVEVLSNEAPIIKLIDTIIRQAVQAKASDIFIEPLEKAVRVRFRVDGVIQEIDRLDRLLHFPVISRIKVISNLDISEHRLPQDGRFKMLLSGNRAVDFRVNVLPTISGEKAVLRILDQNASFLDVNILGFEQSSLDKLKECALQPHGLILTCGPTGSGKTTTLYSILKHVNSPQKNIVTVEDPVEYQLKGLNQVNVKPAIGLTFVTSLRSILRQDPDVILIGEIRDRETLDIAVKAALTGHLVLSSLHTTTAAGSIIRMINMGTEPFLICSSVLAIVAQRLLRKLCMHCREQYTLPPQVAEQVGLRALTKLEKILLYRPKGCPKCLQIGYSGRVGITEILIFTPYIRELVMEREGEFNIKRQARKEGMRTMREDGLSKCLEGLTSLEEVLRITAPDEAR